MSLIELILGEPGKRISKHLAAAFQEAPDEDCCVVPEVPCPPRCPVTIDWRIRRGATPEASILVRNVASVEQRFVFEGSPLSGSGVGTARLEVTPAQATLAPGGVLEVKVALRDSEQLTAAQEYRAEVSYHGSWTQCVRVIIQLDSDPVATATVIQAPQGEPGKADPAAVGASTSRARKSKKKDKFRKGVCAAPEPTLSWRVQRGVIPEGIVRVTNEGRFAQTFELSVSPCSGGGSVDAQVVLEPETLLIPAGKTAVARLRIGNTHELTPGQQYVCEVSVLGFRRQRVPVRLWIEPDPVAHKDVEQGSVPKRVSAHQWFHHFQCTEPCVAVEAGAEIAKPEKP